MLGWAKLVYSRYARWDKVGVMADQEKRLRRRWSPPTVNGILGHTAPLNVYSVREGLPVQTVESLAGCLRVTSAAMQRWLSLSKQTYARRRKQGRLSALESDRVVRYAELLHRAVEFLGDVHAAAHWLNTPSVALGGETPLDHATTEIGARDVLRLIGRLEHGIPT